MNFGSLRQLILAAFLMFGCVLGVSADDEKLMGFTSASEAKGRGR